MSQASSRWYSKTRVIVLSFIVFFPVGFMLVWRHPRWTGRKKKIATALACTVLIAFITLSVVLAPPTVDVTSALSPVRGDDYTLSGKISPPDSKVTVNGKSASVHDGVFSATVGLKEGDNHIEIVVIDDGKQSQKVITIHRYTKSEISRLFPAITYKEVTETQPVHFGAKAVKSSSLAEGAREITTAGVNGSEKLTYKITYTNGRQTDKKLIKTEIVRQPVTQVTTIGTYVASAPATPAPAGNTYTNVDGNQIESPDSNTNGATGVCRDGSYTHAVHHQGACSYHGGVAYWL